MANQGNVLIRPMVDYWDLESLKRHVRARYGKYDTFNEIITEHNKLTTGATAIEIEGLGTTGVTAISQLGRTEVTIELSAAGDHATHNGKVFSLTWEDADGNEYTSEATGTADLATTPVAFATPVTTSVYKVTAFTCSADFTTQDVYAMVSGGDTYATISAAGTTLAATEAQLHGFGSIYVRAVSDHASARSKVMFFEYLSGDGLIKYGHGTIDPTNSTTEIRAFEATDDGDGTTTATTTTIKDFYRIRWLHTAATVDADTDEFLLSGPNSNGTTTQIYGIIDLADQEFSFTRYTCPVGYDAWLAKWDINAPPIAAADLYTLSIAHTDRTWATQRVQLHRFFGKEGDEKPILLAEMSDIIFSVADDATATTLTAKFIIVEARRLS